MLQQQFLNFKEVFSATACHLQEKIKRSTPGQLKWKQGNYKACYAASTLRRNLKMRSFSKTLFSSNWRNLQTLDFFFSVDAAEHILKAELANFNDDVMTIT